MNRSGYKGKTVPSYYWKFNNNLTSIVIRSDREGFPIVKEIPINGKHADKEIDLALQIIDDLNSGRMTLKQLDKES